MVARQKKDFLRNVEEMRKPDRRKAICGGSWEPTRYQELNTGNLNFRWLDFCVFFLGGLGVSSRFNIKKKNKTNLKIFNPFFQKFTVDVFCGFLSDIFGGIAMRKGRGRFGCHSEF